MDPVEMKHVRKLFIDSAAETAKAIREMKKTKFAESPKELNRGAALRTVESILTEADDVLEMCYAGGLDAYNAEIQINLITNKVLFLTRIVQIALPNAGSTLHCVLCGAVKNVRDSVMSLMRNIVTAVVHGSSRIYTDLLADIARLRGEMRFFKTSIQLTNHTVIEERLSIIQKNLKTNAKMMHAEGGNIPLMAARIGYDAASMIEELPKSGFMNTDVRSVISMEELLRKTIYITRRIRWIYKNVMLLKQTPTMVRILDEIENCRFADSGDSKLHPNLHFERKFVLDSSIQGLRSVLSNLIFYL